MNLRSIDLNLLVVLDALLDEAHVGRAARRLNLSQPAASNALQRCRHLFDDVLLERGRGMMRLTPRAEVIRAPLKTLLGEVAALVDPPETPLSEVERTLRLSMADYPAIAVIEPLQAWLSDCAPRVDLVIQPWHGAETAQAALRAGDTDIAVSVFDRDLPDICRRDLLTERYVLALRRGHPAAASLGLDDWLAFPHVVVSSRGAARGNLDEVLSKIGRTRRIGIVVPTFHMVPSLLAQSDMIALLPSRCVAGETGHGLVVQDPPIDIPGFTLAMAWHRRSVDDPVITLAANLLLKAVGTE